MSSTTIGRPNASADRATPHGAASNDVAAGLAQMGYTYRLAWYVSATLYGTGGLLVVILYQLDPNLLPRSNFYLGCIAIAIAALCLISGKLLDETNAHQESLTHVRLSAGFAIYVTAAISLGGKFDAYGLFPLLTVLAPAFLYTWRLSLPYVVVAVASGCAGLILSHGDAQGAHVLVTTFALAVATAAIVVAKERARWLAVHNRELAHTDALTGVANMRGLRERVAAEQGGRPYALFSVDLDNFKQVNDLFDHSTGDEVLRAVANALRGPLAPADLVARRGGDEFALFVSDANERDLDALAGDLRAAICAARRDVCPQISPSGVVAYVVALPGEAIGATLERVDDALRLTKASARAQGARTSRGGESPRVATFPFGVNGHSQQNGAVHGAPAVARGASDRLVAAAVRAFTRSNPAWAYAAVLLALIAIVIAVVALAGLVAPLGAGVGGALAACMLLLALACVWADGAGVSVRYLLVPWTASFCVIWAAIAFAGPSGAALLDLLAVLALYGCLMLGARTAATYLAAALVSYGAFALAGGFAQSVLRTVVAVVVVVVVGGLGARLRHLTVRLARKNLELSELDALTGVANLRGLHERLASAVELATQRQCRPVVLVVDLDGFKQVNDLFGHSTGDRVLTTVARAISECACDDALVARRGGDEFLVVLDDADPGYADLLIRRMQQAIVTVRARVCPDLPTTACVAAIVWRPGESSTDVLRSADLALHDAKVNAHASPPAVEGTLRVVDAPPEGAAA